MTFITYLFTHFDHPFFLLLLFPLILLLTYFIFKDFIHFKDETSEEKNQRKKLKIFIFITRALIFTLLLIAFASPFKEITTTIPGTPKVTLAIDNSSSMRVFSQTITEELKNKLEDQIPVEIASIGKEEHSTLGQDLLHLIKKDDNILLFTDGYANEGTALGDTALYASSINVTINALSLEAEHYDAAVSILGPEKVTANTENTFTISLSKTNPQTVPLTVRIDGEEVYSQQTNASEITIKKIFTDGYHHITATITNKDFFSFNNQYFKTVKVVAKPKVFLLSKNPNNLETLYKPVYELTTGSTLPADLSPYTTLIINDIPATLLDSSIEQLTNFVLEGNGLFVVGGENSYDLGGYKGSRIEQLLPVFVSQPGKKKGEITIVLVVDISGSTGSNFGENKAVDVEKALIIAVLKDLSLIHKVGVVAFNTEAYIVGDMKPLVEHTDLEENIARLTDSGGTSIGVGLLKAEEMLQNQKGSKNIILITDGKTQNEEQAEDAVRLASSQGIRLYIVGVGAGTNEELMKHYAEISNGAFYEPESKDRLKILFGDTESSGSRRAMPYVFVDEKHFISQGLTPKGNIYGFNVVAPKNSGKLIASTDVGDPLLTVGRFGLGRTASLSTDDGTLYAPELLNKDNSHIYTRTTNWLIGDPERKNPTFIQIPDGRIGQDIELIIKNPQEPTLPGITFIKTDENFWKGSIYAKETGFQTLAQTDYAVNYPLEYQNIGQNPDLEKIVQNTGGKMFTKDQINQIVDYVRARSHRQILEKHSYSWIFTLLALGLFLLEVSTRRIIRNFYK